MMLTKQGNGKPFPANPLATNEKNRSHETGNYKPNKAIRR